MKRLGIMAGLVISMVLNVRAQDFGMDRTWDRGREADFVMEAARSGMMEVELGKLAGERAASGQVRDFGVQMERAHNEANDKLQEVAQQLILSMPTVLNDLQQRQVGELRSKSGEDFDRAYMEMMVREHENDISKLEEAQRRASSSELKTWIENTLPLLKQHLEKAEKIKKQL